MAIDLISENSFDKKSIKALLQAEGDEELLLLNSAAKTKEKTIGNFVYLRGLIELSNYCSKNCYYCGIRKGNKSVERYIISDEEIIEAAVLAYNKGLGSLVIQSGEMCSKNFTSRIEKILKQIKSTTNDDFGITLSLGEQSEDTYKRWFDAGAHRYLLRIETSSLDLYHKIHPNNKTHDYEKRLKAIESIRKVGYNVGSGVMIGLPFQTADHLANDLLFLKEIDVDMVGMGPYIEHHLTPLYKYKDLLQPQTERLRMSLKMIACLRLMMPDINIAATTAMQSIDADGREKAIFAGANVVMPNMTPLKYRENYFLYENKTGVADTLQESLDSLQESLKKINHSIGFNQRGDSQHFKNRNN